MATKPQRNVSDELASRLAREAGLDREQAVAFLKALSGLGYEPRRVASSGYAIHFPLKATEAGRFVVDSSSSPIWVSMGEPQSPPAVPTTPATPAVVPGKPKRKRKGGGYPGVSENLGGSGGAYSGPSVRILIDHPQSGSLNPGKVDLGGLSALLSDAKLGHRG
jgi:hypothetical protein